MANGIIYSLVARGNTVLAEFSTASGNFSQVTHIILEKIPSQDSKVSYNYDRFLFNIVVSQGLTYLAMCEEQFERRIAYSFLSEINGRFERSFGQVAKHAVAYEMNKSFSKVLKEQMEYFSNNPSADNVRRVQSEIDEVKSVMVQNIDRLLERGEKIDLLVSKADALNDEAVVFKKRSNTLKRKMWWQNCKLMLVLLLIVAIIITVILLITHPWTHGKKDNSSNNK